MLSLAMNCSFEKALLVWNANHKLTSLDDMLTRSFDRRACVVESIKSGSDRYGS